MQNTEPTRVVIVGGGCSGTLVACNLLKNAKAPIGIELIEKAPDLGAGVAYGTPSSTHLLNVPSQAMSAYVDDPTHLLRWLEANHHDASPLGFIPRNLYKRYLTSCLEDAVKAKSASCSFQVRHETAKNIKRIGSKWEIELETGARLQATSVVLATGLYFHTNQHHSITNPWPSSGDFDLTRVPNQSSIAVIGSGLSMVDMILWLKELNWRGKITVFARNGKLPLPHDRQSFLNKPTINWSHYGNLLAVLKEFNRRRKSLAQTKTTWQGLIDSFRPHTQFLWKNWSALDQKRFLNRLQRRWDPHRHRIAPEIFAQITKLYQDGFFTLVQASVTQVRSHSGCATVEYQPLQKDRTRESPSRSEEFDYALSCAGLESDLKKIRNPIIESALVQGLLQPGPWGKGIKATTEGRVIDSKNQAERNLYTLGFMQHGNLFESVAVPEIRAQAKMISECVLGTGGTGGLTS